VYLQIPVVGVRNVRHYRLIVHLNFLQQHLHVEVVLVQIMQIVVGLLLMLIINVCRIISNWQTFQYYYVISFSDEWLGVAIAPPTFF